MPQPVHLRTVLGSDRTSRLLHVQPLTSAQVCPALALVRARSPQVSPAAWRAFAGARLAQAARGQGGILAASDAKGYILGLAGYLRGTSVMHADTLIIDEFVAVGLLESLRAATVDSLLTALEERAMELDCGGVMAIALAPWQDLGIIRGLDMKSYRPQGTLWYRPLTRPGVRLT